MRVCVCGVGRIGWCDDVNSIENRCTGRAEPSSSGVFCMTKHDWCRTNYVAEAIRRKLIKWISIISDVIVITASARRRSSSSSSSSCVCRSFVRRRLNATHCGQWIAGHDKYDISVYIRPLSTHNNYIKRFNSLFDCAAQQRLPRIMSSKQ